MGVAPKALCWGWPKEDWPKAGAPAGLPKGLEAAADEAEPNADWPNAGCPKAGLGPMEPKEVCPKAGVAGAADPAVANGLGLVPGAEVVAPNED